MSPNRAEMPTGVFARFDDLSPGGQSIVLSDPVQELVAREAQAVPEVLRSAELAARAGRWVAGFVSYEAAAGLDAALPAVEWPSGHPLSDLPLAWFAAFARRQAVEPLEPIEGGSPPVAWQLDRDRRWHRAAVGTIRSAIAAGDYYQLNLTARLTAQLADPIELYAQIAAAQAGSYNSLLVTPEHTVASASPELFFARERDEIVTRPMKGTARRGRWSEEDLASAEALRSSEKDRAENVMIVDLVRNDLGRLARFGSVKVARLFELERYPTLWQLTSTITAHLRQDTATADIFAALFPSGSVTGAPKRAAMQAITAIEQRPRGIYCGAIGYLAPDPDQPAARFSVAIRTLTSSNRSGYAEYGTGGAITWSSDADAEWLELRAKSTVLASHPQPERLIETLRFDPPDTLVNLERHLARMCASADYFGFRFRREAIDAALADALEGRAASARVRILLDPSGRADVELQAFAPTAGVVRLGPSERPIRSDDVLLFHKHLPRDLYDSLRGSRPEYDDVVLWNENRLVTESTTANLAVQIDGRWWTPPLDCGLLPGVERTRLLELGVLHEREITLDELIDVEAVALVNSLRGWRAATYEVTARSEIPT